MVDVSHLELDSISHSKLLDALSDPDEDCSYQVETSAELRSKNDAPPGEFRKYDVLFYYDDDDDEAPPDDARIPVADSNDAHEFESHSTQSATQSQSRSECSPSAERSGASLAEGTTRRSGVLDISAPMPGWSGIGKGLPGGVGRGVSAGLGMARLQPTSSNGNLLGLDCSSERGGIGRNGSGRAGSGAAAAAASAGPAIGKHSQEGSAHADMGIAAAGLAELDLTVEIPDVRKLGMSFIAPSGLTLEGLCERVNQRWAGSTVSLGDATVSAPAPSRVRSLTRRGSGALNAPAHPIHLSKRKRTFDNRLRVWTLTDPPAHALIQVVTAASITLCNGCISLPSAGYWVFTSPDAMLQDMRVFGGTIAVCGKGASLVLAGVSLERCSVVAVGGAQLTMLQCTSTQSNVGVFGSGASTTVAVRGCTMAECRQGACFSNGAEAAVEGLRCRGTSITGVEARHPGTKLHLRRCVVGETHVSRASEWSPRAVFVHSGATAELSECGLWCAAFGLWAEGRHTEVTATQCKVRNNVRSGALVTAGAAATLQRCTLIGSWEFHGVEVGDVGSSARLLDCVMQRNKRCGVVVYDGAAATALRCTAEGNHLAAFKARDCASIRMEECVSRNGGVGLAAVGEGAKGDVVGCTLEGSHHACVQVRCGGAAAIVQSSLRGTRAGPGVCVSGAGSRGDLHDCRVEGHKGDGVTAKQGGEVKAVGCSTERNTGWAFYAEASGSIRAEQCVCEGGGKAFGSDARSTIDCLGCEGE